jgi:hypothetical protein
MGFYILPERMIKKHQRIKRKDTYKKRRRERKQKRESIYQKAQRTSS